MFGIKKLFEEKNVHALFELSLILKGILALFEIAGGILAYFISQQFLLNLVFVITQGELTEDPQDALANFLLHSTQGFSLSAQHFVALYLFGHGLIKLFLIIGLLREKLWYYPTALIVFGLFIVYQLYRWSFTHSLWLLFITVLDAVVIWLTWHEYRYMRKNRPVSTIK